MENKFKMALIIAFYLSKFDMNAVRNLNYKSRAEAFREIGKEIDVNKYTIKQMRDQFDTLHGHRKGYYQFPLPPSRIEVAEKFKLLSETALHEIVTDIVSENNVDTYTGIMESISEKEDKKSTKEYSSRGITGLRAEEIFIDEFSKGNIEELSGELRDTRQDGIGYDFKLLGDINYYIEVKGLAGKSGGIVFTDKEWEKARKFKEKYILVFINNINDMPVLNLIVNPFEKIKPSKYIYTTVAVNWSVNSKQLEI